MCTVVWTKCYSSNLVQRVLEIPCSLVFTGKAKEVTMMKKLKKLYFHYD